MGKRLFLILIMAVSLCGLCWSVKSKNEIGIILNGTAVLIGINSNWFIDQQRNLINYNQMKI